MKNLLTILFISLFIFSCSIQDGEFIEYYDNDKVRVTGTYENGKKVDSWSYYSEDGVLLKTESYYSNNNYIKSKVSTNQIGEIHTITKYKNGKKAKWVKYHERKLVLEQIFTNGEIIKENWFKDGGIEKTNHY